MTDDLTMKRLRMRSWRRGIKEMDLILGPFADVALAALPKAEVSLYERLLTENDQDLYRWVTQGEDAPEAYQPLLGHVRAFHGISLR